MGNCMARTTRKAEESVGLKKSENVDNELLQNKKEIMALMKTLDKMIKQVQAAKTQWGAVTKGVVTYAKISDQVPEVYKPAKLDSVMKQELGTLEADMENCDLTEVTSGLDYTHKYLRECKKTVEMEFKAYEAARVELDLQNSKLGGKVKEDQRAELESKVKFAKSKYDTDYNRVKTNVEKLLKAAPTVAETASLTVIKAYAVRYAHYKQCIEEFDEFHNTGKLSMTMDQIEAAAKAKVEGGVAAPLPAVEGEEAEFVDATGDNVPAAAAPAAPVAAATDAAAAPAPMAAPAEAAAPAAAAEPVPAPPPPPPAMEPVTAPPPPPPPAAAEVPAAAAPPPPPPPPPPPAAPVSASAPPPPPPPQPTPA